MKRLLSDTVSVTFIVAAYVTLVAFEVAAFLLPFVALVATVALVCRMFRSPG